MKIGIFTPRAVEPMHPRLEAFTEYFKGRNIYYDLIPMQKHFIYNRLNWKSLYFFDNYSILRVRNKIESYDLVLINDLKFLPLARYARKKNKPVIYETIDNNVYLRAYSLKKKIPFPESFMNRITSWYSRKEISLATDCCEKIIVNSKSLQEYFGNKAELVYYYSPFEGSRIQNGIKKVPVLLYLGEFSEEKGADEILKLRVKLNIPLFIFGNIRSESLKSATITNPSINYSDKLAHTELINQIRGLSEKYFLLGASLIKPVHQSYAAQEANKDIDYLSLGIPIIGNHRRPTEEKIISGCGVFTEDEHRLKKLLMDVDFREVISDNCSKYYSRYYSKDNFTAALDKIFGDYVR